jgi:hypothetical protein
LIDFLQKHKTFPHEMGRITSDSDHIRFNDVRPEVCCLMLPIDGTPGIC